MRRLVAVALMVSLCCLFNVHAKKGDLRKTKKFSPTNESIKSSLEKDEYMQNILKVLSLNVQEHGGNDGLCGLLKKSDPAIIGFQEVKIPGISSLKQCFKELSKFCVGPKRRARGAKKKVSRRHSRKNCGYEIVGAGSSNSEEETFFTPVIFKRKRSIRTTGNNGTLWLSKTPEIAFTKLDEATSFHIATWVHLKIAVFEEAERKVQSAFERLLTALKEAKIGKSKTEKKKNRPTTKWVDLYVVNTQLNTKDLNISEKQLRILLNYLKEKNIGEEQNNAVILTAGVQPSFADVLATMLGENGYQDAIKDTRSSLDDDTSKTPKTSIIWSKGLENIVSTNVENKDGNKAVISALLYN